MSRSVPPFPSWLVHKALVGGFLVAAAFTVFSRECQAQNVEVVGHYADISAENVTVVGATAYVEDYNSGLYILDVSDPASPALLGIYDIPALELAGRADSTGTGTAADVSISSHTAYVVGQYSGVDIVDVSNPAQPVQLGRFNPDINSNGIYDAAVLNGRAYVVGASGFHIADLSDPASPVRLGGDDTLYFPQAVTVLGTTAYIAGGSRGLEIFDVSNPALPVRLGAYDTPVNARGVTVLGGKAYVADSYFGLQIIDVANPASPGFLGAYDTYGDARRVAVSGSAAYLTNGLFGVLILDVSDPASPTLLGAYDTPGNAMDVELSGGLFYVADSYGGLYILRFTGPTPPESAFSRVQQTKINSRDGSGYQELVYNYETGAAHVSPYRDADGFVAYDLPGNRRTGVFHYDYWSGRFTQGTYKVNLPRKITPAF